MKSHEKQIAAQKALVLRELGIDPNTTRVFESQVGPLSPAGTLLRLPPIVGEPQQDPVTGARFFVIGLSELGGPDPLT